MGSDDLPAAVAEREYVGEPQCNILDFALVSAFDMAPPGDNCPVSKWAHIDVVEPP